MHLLCCCRVGHEQEYFEARYGRDVSTRKFYTVKKTNLIEITNKMRPCNRIYYSSVS
jgi:hypothetical protein